MLVVDVIRLWRAIGIEPNATGHGGRIHRAQRVANAISLKHLNAQGVGLQRVALAIRQIGEAVARLQRAAQHQGLQLVEVERAF